MTTPMTRTPAHPSGQDLCPLRPLAGYAVLRWVRPERVTDGGIFLPEGWRGRYKYRPRDGEVRAGVVMAVGPGGTIDEFRDAKSVRRECRRLADGTFAKTLLAAGDRVVWKWYADTRSWKTPDGREWWIVEQADVLSVVGEEAVDGAVAA